MKSLEELRERWPTVSLLATATLLLLLTTVVDHGGCQTTGGVEGNKLLLILVGGCRWDYPDQDPNLRGFRRIAEEGTRAPDVTPIFPTNTYPNSYAVVTGLFAESHGFVQNMMYDPKYDDFFLMAPNDTASVSHWWNNAEPLWVTAERSGIRSALFWWDGCQVEIRGTKPTFCRKYKFVGNLWTSVNADTKDAILTAIELFESDEIQLVQIYYEPIDFYGHKHGPDSIERKEAVRNIDSLLVLLQEEITLRELTDEVNIVVLSDHGMLATDPDHINRINLQSKVDVNDIRYMVYYGASSMILPKDGKLEKLYNTLRYIPGLDVYLKDQIPERYHLRKSRLSLPLLLVAQRNFFIQGLDIPGKSIPTGSSVPLGSHGYDPEEVPEMKGIFFAKGPAFKKRHVSPPLQIVDIYNILCGVLGIKALPNNGSRTIFSDILISNDCSSTFGCRYSTFCTYAVFSLHITLFTSIFHT